MLLSQRTQAAIRQIWEAFSADGVPPHLATRQVSFLILLKLLDERTAARRQFHEAGLSETIQWRQLQILTSEVCLEHLRGPVSAWLRESTWATTMPVLAQATFTMTKDHVLALVMRLIDDLFASFRPFAVHAAIYDAFLKKAEEEAAVWAQPAGQYFTPMHLAHLLADLVQPQPGETVADLACGNGRLLLAAFQHVQQMRGKQAGTLVFCPDGNALPPLGVFDMTEPGEAVSPLQLFGVDRDPEAAWQAWMYLFCLGVPAPAIRVADTLSRGFGEYLEGTDGFDVILGNPPYGSVVDQDDMAEPLRRLGTRNAEMLFLALIMQVLRPGGRAAVIVPEGLLFGQGRTSVSLRRRLLNECTLHAIVSLPQGAFLPYTGVKTSILLFSRGGPTTDVWFYQVEKEGTELSAKRVSRPDQTDLPDLLVKYGLRCGRQALSAFVNANTWFCWENVHPALASNHYTRPFTVNRYVLDDVGCPTKISVCHGAMAVPLDVSKDWSVAVSDLGPDANLVAGRYAPLTFPAQRKASLSPAKTRLEDEVSDLPRRRVRLGKQRQSEDMLSEVFTLPEQRDEGTLQAWFDQGIHRLFVLRDEGMLTRDDLRQLIEMLLEVQHKQARNNERREAQKPGIAVDSTVREACEQFVLMPLALEWDLIEEIPGRSSSCGAGRKRTPRRKSDLFQQRFLLEEESEMNHQ